jgi:hypothetical protein
MAKPKPFNAAPGGSDMRMAEALKRVLRLASRAYDHGEIETDTERDCEAISLVHALAVGTYRLKLEGADG